MNTALCNFNLDPSKSVSSCYFLLIDYLRSYPSLLCSVHWSHYIIEHAHTYVRKDMKLQSTALQLYIRMYVCLKWHKTTTMYDFCTIRPARRKHFKIYEHTAVSTAVRAHVQKSVTTLIYLPIIFHLVNRDHATLMYTIFIWNIRPAPNLILLTATFYATLRPIPAIDVLQKLIRSCFCLK